MGNAQHPSYLPPSACLLLTQPAKTNLTSDEMAWMQKFAVRAPCDNAKSISESGFTTLGLARTQSRLATLGVAIDPKRMTLRARVLPQPTVKFSNKEAQCNGQSKWNLSTMKFKSAIKLGKWACLNFHSGQSPSYIHNQCLANFVDVLKACGIDASVPQTTHLRAGHTEKSLEKEFKKFTGIHFLLVVLPDNGSQLYNRVKLLGDVRTGIQTICVVGNHSKFYNINRDKKNSLRSISYNACVALKVNIKNGGINHVLRDGQLGFISEGKTMVVGIDVTHPSPGSGLNVASVAAMVASADKHLAQWPAEIRINPARQEKVETLRSMLRAHLTYWKEKQGSLPEKLLIYRDGVSEGQYQMVLDEELPKLRAACESVYREQQLPRITLIVVGKRHHTRFYHTDFKTRKVFPEMDGNPVHGTVSPVSSVSASRMPRSSWQVSTGVRGAASFFFSCLLATTQFCLFPKTVY